VPQAGLLARRRTAAFRTWRVGGWTQGLLAALAVHLPLRADAEISGHDGETCACSGSWLISYLGCTMPRRSSLCRHPDRTPARETHHCLGARSCGRVVAGGKRFGGMSRLWGLCGLLRRVIVGV